MDELQRSLLNVFTYSDLDRKVKHRKNQDWLQALQSAPSSRHLVYSSNRFLVRTGVRTAPHFLKGNDIDRLALTIKQTVYLGSRKSKHYFATAIEYPHTAQQMTEETLEFIDLRKIGRSLKARNASLLSYAKAIFNWHDRHVFCGVCGCRTLPKQGGHVRQCSSDGCATTHFPRTDPAIIVAVCRAGKCLFGRQKSWPPKRFSVIAGFVEPGESVEQAVAREVHEETNIDIRRMHYHSSQPWPFPGSIMLGFTATAASETIILNDGELQEAHWRSVDEVIDGLTNDEFRLPTPLSIAYRLIEDWFNTHCEEPLASVVKRLDADRSW